MKKSLTALLLAFTFTTSAIAQAPTDASLAKFLQLSEMDKSFEIGLYASLDSQRQLFEQQIAQKQGITPEQVRQIGAIFEKYNRQMAEQILTPTNRQKVNQAFIDVAKKHYTQAEVDAYNQFLSTPIGKSVTQKSNAMMPEYLSMVETLTHEMLKNSSVNYADMEQEIEKELANIFKE